MNFVRLAYSFTCASNLNTGFKKVSNPSGLYEAWLQIGSVWCVSVFAATSVAIK